ncbi:MAG TPA: phytanoyl-CoA dioxygenase family protein [Chloroflexota bacterium]
MNEAYRKNGFAIYRGALGRDVLAEVGDVMLAALSHGVELDARSLHEAIMERERQDHAAVYRSSVVVGSSFAGYKLLATSKIMPIALELTGAPLAMLHVMPLHVITQIPHDDSFDYRWHQESAFYPWCQDMLSMWFPIDQPVALATGTMSVVPGSHVGGLRPYRSHFLKEPFRQLECELGADEEQGAVPIEIEPGDLVAFDAHLVHRSMPNGGETPRLTGAIRIVNMATQAQYRPLYKPLSYDDFVEGRVGQ